MASRAGHSMRIQLAMAFDPNPIQPIHIHAYLHRSPIWTPEDGTHASLPLGRANKGVPSSLELQPRTLLQTESFLQIHKTTLEASQISQNNFDINKIR